MNKVAPIGHNHPPEPTPFDLVSEQINDLYHEAKNFLDGEPITTQGLADAVGKLLNDIRRVEKEADEARKEEKRPFDEGAKAVQVKYKPLLDKAKLASDTCKKALVPWLEKQEAERRAAAEAARKEAEEKQRKAMEAMRQAQTDDLTAREQAEDLLKEAKAAEKEAIRAEKDGAKASGGSGRAVTLRTIYTTEIIDLNEAVKHYWRVRRSDFEELVMKLAAEDVRMGNREIPGISVNEERRAQ